MCPHRGTGSCEHVAAAPWVTWLLSPSVTWSVTQGVTQCVVLWVQSVTWWGTRWVTR